MNFLDQPQDVIINEQLVKLPINELFLSCSTNKSVAQICAGKQLWRARIRNEDPTVDVRNIEDPREYYLKRFVFGGRIYIHNYVQESTFSTDIRELQFTTQELERMVLPYNELFSRAKQIAEDLKPNDRNYVIIYSRGTQFEEGYQDIPMDMKLDVTAIQVGDSVEYLRLGDNMRVFINDEGDIEIAKDPIGKIVLVDIVYIPEYIDYQPDIDRINELKKLDPRDIVDVMPGIPPGLRMEAGEIIADKITEHVIIFTELLTKLHKEANTEFYQQEMRFIHHISLSATRKPIIAPFLPSRSGDINERKRVLLENVLNTVSNEDFDARNSFYQERYRRNYLGFKSYEDFIEFQGLYINALSEQQLQTVEFVIDKLPAFTTNTPRAQLIFDINGNITWS